MWGTAIDFSAVLAMALQKHSQIMKLHLTAVGRDCTWDTVYVKCAIPLRRQFRNHCSLIDIKTVSENITDIYEGEIKSSD